MALQKSKILLILIYQKELQENFNMKASMYKSIKIKDNFIFIDEYYGVKRAWSEIFNCNGNFVWKMSPDLILIKKLEQCGPKEMFAGLS